MFKIEKRPAADGHVYTLLSPGGVSLARETNLSDAIGAAVERGVTEVEVNL